jgi:hypothetical protein
MWTMTRQEALEVYKERVAKFKNTQSIQWRMNLSVWTLLVLAIHYKTDFMTSSCDWPCIYFPTLAVALIPIIHIVYCIMTQSSLAFDKATMTHLLDQLNDNNATSIDFRPTKSFIDWRGYIWITLQSMVTIVLLLVYLTGK